MALTLYDATVPNYRQYLGGLSGILAKADAHCASGAASEAEWLASRLRDDMFPLVFQVEGAVIGSAGAVAYVRGLSYARERPLTTFAECKAAVDAAGAYLEGVRPSDLELGDIEIEWRSNRGRFAFTPSDYLLSQAVGNFFFHVTTAYDILRHLGLSIGKWDYLGALRMTPLA